MGFLDRLIGRLTGSPNRDQQYYGQQQYGQQQYDQQGHGRSGPLRTGGQARHSDVQDQVPGRGQSGRMSDKAAIQRYRYLLSTAPPERIEQAHAEAFAQLTPQQRQQVLEELSRSSDEPIRDDSPQSLARAATRLEMRRPGTLERSFGGARMAGMGMGGMLLGTVAGAFIGTAIANEMFDNDGFLDGGGEEFADGGEAGEGGDGFSDFQGADGGEGSGFADGGGFGDFGGDAGGFGDLGGFDF